MEPKNILVVDDEVDICRVFETMLEEFGYSVITESDPRNVLDIVRKTSFDVAVLDLVMPQMDGLELIERIREHTADLPILVVTGYGSAESTVEAMRRGATDFVTKPVDAEFLDLRIRRAFDMEHARRLANTDGLTGLYNHRHLQERLQQEVERAERYGRPLSVIMADLDHFKQFNDTYGHPRGDEALIQVARTLRQVCRSADIVARYGGEEFTLVLPETPGVEAGVLAERARQCVEALEVSCVGPEARLTMSLGVAAFQPGQSKVDLVEGADAALYEAKHRGRNRVCFVGEVGQDPSANEDSDVSTGELIVA